MKKGFTLVEIMIVVAIIGLLAAIAIPSFMRARLTSQANACINNLRQIESAKDQYALENSLTNGQAISTINNEACISNLVSIGTTPGGYIKSYPYCPGFTNTATLASAAASYDVNGIGTNAACHNLAGAVPPHALK